QGRRHRPHHRDPGGARHGARVGELPAARLAGVPPAVLGLPHPDRALRVVRRGPRPGRPAAGDAAGGPARRRPGAQGHLGVGGRHLRPTARPPAGAAPDWVNVSCPECGGAATRDTDTMDTFVDSSWYFFRYCSPGYEDGPFDVEQVRKWMPVDQYTGGVEHAILHLLYSRFFTKVLYDMGMVDFTEPFRRLLNQGQVINQGKAMSKSLGNGVDLGEQIAEFGVDVVRLALLFAGPPEDDIDWADVSTHGMSKFLSRVHRIATEVSSDPGVDVTSGDPALRRVTARTIDETTTQIENQRFNVAIARIMELVSATRKAIDSGPGPADPAVREAAETVAVMLSLFAPYTAEEAWELLGREAPVIR